MRCLLLFSKESLNFFYGLLGGGGGVTKTSLFKHLNTAI
jgi:hypothetical protein